MSVDNAIIMAAGVSSRFAPLSYERAKALTEVKGEILIERQIVQLKEAGICDIYIVVGYMAEQFEYLRDGFGIHIVKNDAYMIRNNHSSIYAVKDIIRNTYICSADNYFGRNPFEQEVAESYYAAVYASGITHEWCMETGQNGYIGRVEVGGQNAWYMLGHSFWSEDFGKVFLQFLDEEYDRPETQSLYLIDWEYAGMNDGMWDLADVSIEAGFSAELDKALLTHYLDRDPTTSEEIRFFANKLYLDFLWSLWGKARVPFDGQPMEDYAVERYECLKGNLDVFFSKLNYLIDDSTHISEA